MYTEIENGLWNLWEGQGCSYIKFLVDQQKLEKHLSGKNQNNKKTKPWVEEAIQKSEYNGPINTWKKV